MSRAIQEALSGVAAGEVDAAAAASQAFGDLQQACSSCHTVYRNR